MDSNLITKAALLQMTATEGWRYAQSLADQIVTVMERKAIDEEDDDKAKGLRRDARGARAFLAAFRKAIEIAKSVEPEPEDISIAID